MLEDHRDSHVLGMVLGYVHGGFRAYGCFLLVIERGIHSNQQRTYAPQAEREENR